MASGQVSDHRGLLSVGCGADLSGRRRSLGGPSVTSPSTDSDVLGYPAPGVGLRLTATDQGPIDGPRVAGLRCPARGAVGRRDHRSCAVCLLPVPCTGNRATPLSVCRAYVKPPSDTQSAYCIIRS
jgi:hypothetical protein